MAQADVDRARAFYAALRALDLAAMFELLSPDVELRHSELVPWGGEQRGYDGVRRFLERLVLSVDARFEVTDVVDARDIVVTGRLRGRARTTGAWFDVRFLHIWRTSDGRLARLDSHVDMESLRQALAGPAPLLDLTVGCCHGQTGLTMTRRARAAGQRRGGLLAAGVSRSAAVSIA